MMRKTSAVTGRKGWVVQKSPREKPSAAVGTMNGMFTRTSRMPAAFFLRERAMRIPIGIPRRRTIAVTTPAIPNDRARLLQNAPQSAV